MYGIISDDDRADARVLLVALRDDHDERQVDHQRRDHVDRRVADPVGGEDVCGATPSRRNSGTKIGAKIAHFGHDARDDEVEQRRSRG